ncbi:MAG TPA: exodeoxyribonuclease VII small subunit [Candidatus Binatia bacterium]
MSEQRDTAQAAARPTFEEGMRTLESIVSRLEAGNLPLEESLEAFEQGVAMLRTLHAQLGEVERRVEILLRDAGGVLRTRDGSELTR